MVGRKAAQWAAVTAARWAYRRVVEWAEQKGRPRAARWAA